MKAAATASRKTGAAPGRGYGPRGGLASAGARPAPPVRAWPGAGWPLFSGLGPLGVLPTAPRLARTFTVLVLGCWGMRGWAEVSELIVSELTVNVVRAAVDPDGHPRYDHGGLPVMWLLLMASRSRLRIEVWDSLPPDLGVPTARRAGPDDETGRGLGIVTALSQDWGWDVPPGWRGKRVWALPGRP
jgi:hypothetical protein